MITKEQIAEMERNLELSQEQDSQGEKTRFARDAGFVLDSAMKIHAQSLLTLARAALDEIEHHESEIEQLKPFIACSNRQLIKEANAMSYYHRARLAKLKGE